MNRDDILRLAARIVYECDEYMIIRVQGDGCSFRQKFEKNKINNKYVLMWSDYIE